MGEMAVSFGTAWQKEASSRGELPTERIWNEEMAAHEKGFELESV